MPRAGQIIPKYIHPHDEIFINDNTEYQEYTDNTAGLKYFCAYPAKKGRDKLIYWNNFYRWWSEHGYPNFRLYGQSTYMPYTLLYNGLAEVYGYRITASDATYSNLIFVVGYKISDGKLVLRHKIFTRTKLRTTEDLEAYANTLETTKPDEDGFIYMPIMTFWSIGKGEYGNDFRIRIQHDKAMDKQNDYKNYSVDILSTENGASLLRNFSVTFYIDGQDPNTKVTNYIEEVINDEDGNGSQHVNMAFFYDNYLTLFEKYKEAYNAGGVTTLPQVISVDRLPGLTLPRTDAIYHLTEDDGSYAAGMYVYSGGIYTASAYTVENATMALPDVSTASTSIIYNLDVAYTDNGVTYTPGYYITTDNVTWTSGPDIIDVTRLPSTALYAEDTVYKLTDDDGGKMAGTMWIYDSSAEDYISYTVPEVEEVEPLDIDISTFDMFGYNRFTKTDDTLIEIDGGAESLAVFDIEGVAMQSGSDASMGEDQDVATRQAAMDEAYIKVFSGGADRMIYSKRRTPIEILLDANLSVNVKKQMAAFALKRGDFMCYLDFGLLETTADVENMAVLLDSLDSYLISKNSGKLNTLDPISGKNIPVSITMWLASQFPMHVYQYKGVQTPFAGEKYAILSGYTSVKSVKPVYDEYLDADILEELYDRYRINYLEAMDEKTIVRGTQITSQKKYSDLSKENNVLITLEIQRKIERMIAKNRYNWTDTDEINTFREDCNQVFSSYIGTKCKSLTIDVQQNAWEKTRYITHVYMGVVFRTYQERGIVEIDINPRA